MFPNITVEVETTHQVCHLSWYLRSYDIICKEIFFYYHTYIVICSLTLLLRWRQRPSQVSHGIFDNVCIMYIISNEIISYCHIFCDIFFTLLLWEQNWIRSESKFYCNWLCFRLWGTKGSICSISRVFFLQKMILPLKKKELISDLFFPLQFVALKNEDPQNQLCIKFKTLMTPSKIGRMQVDDDSDSKR